MDITTDNRSASSTSASTEAPIGQPSVSDRVTALFNEATGTAQPTPVQEVQAASTETQPVTPPQPEAPVVQPTQAELLAGRFKGTDELVKGYQNLQSIYTKTAQETAESKKMIEALQQQKAELENKLKTPVTEQKPPIDTTDLDAESYLAQFYEKPQDTIAKIVEASIKKALEPLEQRVMPVVQKDEMRTNQELWDNHVTEFAGKNKDMPEFTDGMKEYITKNNLQNSKDPGKVLEDAYMYARGQKYQPQQSTDYNALLNDEKFLNDYLSKNQNALNYVLKNHMQSIKDNQPPTSINSQGSGTTVATPPNKPKNMNEAHTFFESMLGLIKK